MKNDISVLLNARFLKAILMITNL